MAVFYKYEYTNKTKNIHPWHVHCAGQAGRVQVEGRSGSDRGQHDRAHHQVRTFLRLRTNGFGVQIRIRLFHRKSFSGNAGIRISSSRPETWLNCWPGKFWSPWHSLFENAIEELNTPLPSQECPLWTSVPSVGRWMRQRYHQDRQLGRIAIREASKKLSKFST